MVANHMDRKIMSLCHCGHINPAGLRCRSRPVCMHAGSVDAVRLTRSVWTAPHTPRFIIADKTSFIARKRVYA
jgi:hypothetical protein